MHESWPLLQHILPSSLSPDNDRLGSVQGPLRYTDWSERFEKYMYIMDVYICSKKKMIHFMYIYVDIHVCIDRYDTKVLAKSIGARQKSCQPLQKS